MESKGPTGQIFVVGDAFVDVVAANVSKLPEWNSDTCALLLPDSI